MNFILQPWQLMLIILASWINRQQQEVIESLRTENAVLKEQFGNKRILLTDEPRHSLDESSCSRVDQLRGWVFQWQTILDHGS